VNRKHRIRELTASGPEKIAAAALSLFGLIAFAVTVVAIVESYSNLLAFAHDHGLHGWRAAIAPAAVDSFIVMGELLLFAAVLLAWDSKLAAATGYVMTVWGFGLSVAGNVWHAASASPADRAVAAIWPVTATAGLAGGLIIIKRVMASRGPGVTAVPVVTAEKPSPGPASRNRETASGVVPGRAARTTGLVAASAHEQAVVLRLVTAGRPFPSIRVLAASDFGGSIRASQRVLKLAASRMNGGGHVDAGRS
jgi:hypothetical protein